MYEPFTPTMSFIDVTLPMLPGQIGPGSSTAVLRLDASLSTETVTFDRLEMPQAVIDEPEVDMENLRTMILDRPEEPYSDWTKARLYKRAKELGLPGRSKLSKAALREALIAFEGR